MFNFFADVKKAVADFGTRLKALELKVESLFTTTKTTVEAPVVEVAKAVEAEVAPKAD